MPDPGHFEINLSGQYTRVLGGTTATVPGFEINYGVIERLQISVAAQLALSHVDGVGANAGPGDVRIALKYRFIDAAKDGWRPDVAFAPAITIPSGSQQRGLGAGQIQGFLPLWVAKEFGPWTVFGGGGYTINPGPGRLNWWFAGLGVKREIDANWSFGAEIFQTTATQRGGKDSTGFNLAALYNFNETHHIMAAVGRNLLHARENNEFSALLNYQITF
ncbi:MAG: hypothetical protein EXR07_19720 [Acetobacteraceae bacterium]|nr:hypothetical protein [Acetobacteraceae bacterium]